jgi:hypothetical protein
MLIYFLGWVIGTFIGSFFVVQPLIIIFFSIPTTIKLRNSGALATNVRLITRDVVSIVVQIGILLLITWITKISSHNLLVGYYVGIAIILFFGIGKVFRNKNNVADYVERNIKFLHPDFINSYVLNITSTEPDSEWLEKHLKFIYENSLK